MNVKLKDVAQKAQVTLTTASIVLNNRTSPIPVSEETRGRVRLAAKQLNYQPNYAARSLRTNRTDTIGVISASSRDQWCMLDSAEAIAEAEGFELLMAISRWDVGTEEKSLRRLLNRRVDGILIFGPAIEEAERRELPALAAGNFPLVGTGPLVVPGIDFVDFDRTAMLEKMTAHLLAQGCRTFAFLENTATPGCRLLLAGIEAALKKHPAAAFTPLQFRSPGGTLSWEQMYARIAAYLKTNRPDAVICRTDEIAIMVIQAAKRQGIIVPEQMAVSGSGNNPLGANLMPPLTTTDIPWNTIAREAMVRLIERINKPAAQHEHLAKLIPAELVIRESSLFTRRPAEKRAG